RELMEEWDEPVDRWRLKPDAKTEPNPYTAVDPSRPWPLTEQGAEALRRLDAAARVAAADPAAPDDVDLTEAAVIAEWDAEIDRLLAEARRERAVEVAVPLPPSLSATSVTRLRDDPDGFAAELA